jgi:hypothetical protein
VAQVFKSKPVVVLASKITGIAPKDAAGRQHLTLDDGSSYVTSQDQTAAYQPVAGDYLVVTGNGAATLVPQSSFEGKYDAVAVPAS